MADLPKPFMWTLSATVKARQTTTNCFLWFSDPQSSSWEPLFTADQLRAYAAAKVAEERERCARLCESRTKYATPDEYDQAALDCAAAIRGTEAASA